jgi:hypothetical protein
MGKKFVVEDEFHADWVATFPSREESLVLADRLRSDSDAEENKPPCTSWRTCRREYYLLEYEDTTKPWTLVRREPLFEIDFGRGGEVRAISPE